MALSVPAPFDPSQAVIIDVCQDFNSYSLYGGNPPVLSRGPWSFPNALAAPSIGTRVDGTPLGTVGQVATSAGTDETRELGGIAFPVWASMAALPRSRRPRRYATGLTIRATLRGTAGVEFALTTGANFVTFGIALIGWCSYPAINGGAWTPCWRLANGGPIVLGSSSNVQLDASFHVLEIRFDEGGRWSWLMDGTTVYEFTGLNFNAVGGASWTSRWATERIVGTTYQFQNPFFRVSEI